MPRLWDDTIEAHRHAVREAIFVAARQLASDRGVLAVTMSEVADRAGIGRATLYKYFPSVQAILVAWHEQLLTSHLAELIAVRDQPGRPVTRLRAVLEAYALISHRQGEHGSDLRSFLHQGAELAHAEHRLTAVIRSLLIEATAAGEIRDDVPPSELAAYCLHALGAASSLPSQAAVRRLVTVTMAGLDARS